MLIVDDNIFNIITLQMMLEPLNLKSDMALNGLDALEKIKSRREQAPADNMYKVVFMDCNMPVMDGFQASKAISEFFREDWKNKPVVAAVTAYTN